VEVETGKGSDALERRPQLTTALNVARKRKGSVVVAKLDLGTMIAAIGMVALQSDSDPPSHANHQAGPGRCTC
jgi:hypothetical protein